MNASATSPSHPRGRGVFICFEGGEACGKTTQIAMLDRRLRAIGIDAVLTREPGGTRLGASLRRELLHAEDVSARAEALLYAADRAHHVATVITPALEAGRVVISDRYEDSSIAYQGVARGLGQTVAELSAWASGGLVPDVTILLDADPQIAHRRREGAGDRLEAEPLAFHQAVRRGFLDRAEQAPERYLVLDACADRDSLAEAVWQRIAPLVSGERP
ncbi:dTMP kinase [Nanchangia anserum]|uniref:Thymidylate kinase n=1 Tax=Nanchangia anserum TaxID=2692125 RepID=A0A8I0GCK0_9ACTO|nr:dTMP kinase [Nanchangia anserum]MBD3689665.1 dTMP kinase [Nanchangia anserum]QOX81844.1 dTMP kinase [Nanchangia anserum]